MLIQIDTRGGVPIYRQLMDQVTRMILSGQLAAGEQLDSVASLAGRLNVNPMTISKAYGFLVESGLVERRAGVGLFVRPVEDDRKRGLETQFLAEALERAAAQAIQLGMERDDAVRLFVEQLERMQTKKERSER